jgi:hypothetical protein
MPTSTTSASPASASPASTATTPRRTPWWPRSIGRVVPLRRPLRQQRISGPARMTFLRVSNEHDTVGVSGLKRVRVWLGHGHSHCRSCGSQHPESQEEEQCLANSGGHLGRLYVKQEIAGCAEGATATCTTRPIYVLVLLQQRKSFSWSCEPAPAPAPAHLCDCAAMLSDKAAKDFGRLTMNMHSD